MSLFENEYSNFCWTPNNLSAENEFFQEPTNLYPSLQQNSFQNEKQLKKKSQQLEKETEDEKEKEEEEEQEQEEEQQQQRRTYHSLGDLILPVSSYVETTFTENNAVLNDFWDLKNQDGIKNFGYEQRHQQQHVENVEEDILSYTSPFDQKQKPSLLNPVDFRFAGFEQISSDFIEKYEEQIFFQKGNQKKTSNEDSSNSKSTIHGSVSYSNRFMKSSTNPNYSQIKNGNKQNKAPNQSPNSQDQDKEKISIAFGTHFSTKPKFENKSKKDSHGFAIQTKEENESKTSKKNSVPILKDDQIGNLQFNSTHPKKINQKQFEKFSINNQESQMSQYKSNNNNENENGNDNEKGNNNENKNGNVNENEKNNDSVNEKVIGNEKKNEICDEIGSKKLKKKINSKSNNKITKIFLMKKKISNNIQNYIQKNQEKNKKKKKKKHKKSIRYRIKYNKDKGKDKKTFSGNDQNKNSLDNKKKNKAKSHKLIIGQNNLCNNNKNSKSFLKKPKNKKNKQKIILKYYNMQNNQNNLNTSNAKNPKEKIKIHDHYDNYNSGNGNDNDNGNGNYNDNDNNNLNGNERKKEKMMKGERKGGRGRKKIAKIQYYLKKKKNKNKRFNKYKGKKNATQERFKERKRIHKQIRLDQDNNNLREKKRGINSKKSKKSFFSFKSPIILHKNKKIRLNFKTSRSNEHGHKYNDNRDVNGGFNTDKNKNILDISKDNELSPRIYNGDFNNNSAANPKIKKQFLNYLNINSNFMGKNKLSLSFQNDVISLSSSCSNSSSLTLSSSFSSLSLSSNSLTLSSASSSLSLTSSLYLDSLNSLSSSPSSNSLSSSLSSSSILLNQKSKLYSKKRCNNNKNKNKNKNKKNNKNKKKERMVTTKYAKKIFEKWFQKHCRNVVGPYPTKKIKKKLAKKTFTSQTHVNRWFAQRRRVEKMKWVNKKIDKPPWLKKKGRPAKN
ncbi:homeobox protein meis2 [Anaeramoeba flamelloides]|uniref:Homeobox protein meis2 n=1 Tax=Anaeramoeba flamelloides TaxID=1746091 RepID=A0AAV7ZI59_9EUKA|nr:homeobox protein meis2 [Anaeramoeba flamelloides]